MEKYEVEIEREDKRKNRRIRKRREMEKKGREKKDGLFQTERSEKRS